MLASGRASCHSTSKGKKRESASSCVHNQRITKTKCSCIMLIQLHAHVGICVDVDRNRPIVLLGSGLETGRPDRTAALYVHFTMLKTVKFAYLCHPPQFSCRVFLQESFCVRRFLDFSNDQWLFVYLFIYFLKKSCGTCGYQLCVRIYACTTSTAFTLAPCWHQIRMHLINSLHFCAFASAFNNCKPNSSAKISKKRSKTFHLAVKGIQHTSR